MFGLACGAAASFVLSAPAPAFAVPTQVTDVLVSRTTDDGVNVVLQTSGGDRPQVFTVQQGNSAIADIIDAQLDGQKEYRFPNPSAEISSVSVTSLDENSIRITVTGFEDAPNPPEILDRDSQEITLSFLPNDPVAENDSIGPPGFDPDAGASIPGPPIAFEDPIPAPAPIPSTAAIAQNPDPVLPSDPIAQNPDVLVPSPEITIEGIPIPSGEAPGVSPAPPFLPSAVAPPLGPQVYSTIDPSPTPIDLSTAEILPRLVLRDAPVRDVLSLLARAAGLNLVYIEGPLGNGPPGGDDEGEVGRTISLDVQNEPIQDVFNNILRVSGFEANRTGRSIFVGPRLPDEARNLVSRTIRLNQVLAFQARDILIEQGAERNEVTLTTQLATIGEGAAARTVTSTTTQVELIAPDTLDERYEGFAALPLRGLLVAADPRTNSITVLGDPRKVEIASSILAQLDLRLRQVAVNVKVIDINLLNTEDFNSSFSFGINDTFVVSDGGSALINFGSTNPPTTDATLASPIIPTVIPNPIQGTPFFDTSTDFPLPALQTNIVQVDQNGNIQVSPGGVPTIPLPFSQVDDPLAVGITEFTAGTDTVITTAADGTVTTTLGTPGTVTTGLTDLFQFPTRFLLTLQAQVVNGNAKILTDPTLVVQEGQSAVVNLTQDVIREVNVDFVDTPSGTRQTSDVEFEEVGLILSVNVERIDDNGFVTLSVIPDVTAPAQQVDLGGGSFATTVQRRVVQSGSIRLRDGQTLILSGIIQDSDRTTVTKWPILGDLPIIGTLFRSTNRENQRQEVLVLLTPQILDDSGNSSFGYSYTPGRDARELLQEGGFRLPGQ